MNFFAWSEKIIKTVACIQNYCYILVLSSTFWNVLLSQIRTQSRQSWYYGCPDCIPSVSHAESKHWFFYWPIQNVETINTNKRGNHQHKQTLPSEEEKRNQQLFQKFFFMNMTLRKLNEWLNQIRAETLNEISKVIFVGMYSWFAIGKYVSYLTKSCLCFHLIYNKIFEKC